MEGFVLFIPCACGISRQYYGSDGVVTYKTLKNNATPAERGDFFRIWWSSVAEWMEKFPKGFTVQEGYDNGVTILSLEDENCPLHEWRKNKERLDRNRAISLINAGEYLEAIEFLEGML